MGQIQYARSGDASIVFREFDGAREGEVVVVTSSAMSIDAWIDDRVGRRLIEGLRELGKVVVFDRRGVGLSDPLTPEIDMLRVEWSQNLAAVIDAAALDRPVVVALSNADPAMLLARRSPGRLRSVVAYEPIVPWCTVGSDGVRLDQAGFNRGLRDFVDVVGLICPTRAEEPGFREWFERAGQLGASPAAARRLYEDANPAETALLEDAYRNCDLPRILLRRRRASLLNDAVIDHLFHDAPRVDLPGRDGLFLGEQADALIAEISRFTTGEVRLPEPARTVAAILFTDLVDSTERVRALGDRRWRSLIDTHDEKVRRIVEHRGGRVVKSTGDGVMGLLPSAVSAVEAAREVRRTLRDDDLEVRIGIHVGDVDARGEDVSGLAVNIAARIMAMAGPGEVLVSESTALAAAGEGSDFAARGQFPLKGVPGLWAVHALEARRRA